MSVEQLAWLLPWVFQRRLKGSWVNAWAGHRGTHLGEAPSLSQDTGGVFWTESSSRPHELTSQRRGKKGENILFFCKNHRQDP